MTQEQTTKVKPNRHQRRKMWREQQRQEAGDPTKSKANEVSVFAGASNNLFLIVSNKGMHFMQDGEIFRIPLADGKKKMRINILSEKKFAEIKLEELRKRQVEAQQHEPTKEEKNV